MALSAETYSISGVLVGLFAVLATFYFVVHSRREKRQDRALGAFARALMECTTPIQCLQAYAQFSSRIVGNEHALLVIGDRRAELIAGEERIPTEFGTLCRALLVVDLSQPLVETPHVRGIIVHGYDLPLERVAQRVHGVGMSRGILVEIKAGVVDDNTNRPEDTIQARLFLPLGGFLVPTVIREELELLSYLAMQLELRLQSFAIQTNLQSREQQARAAHAQRDYELSTLVHEINNTAQDISLLAESVIDNFPSASRENVIATLKRVVVTAKSMALAVSDIKRRRELEGSEDIAPREEIDLVDVMRQLVVYGSSRAERKRVTVLPTYVGESKSIVKVSAREHLEAILRNLVTQGLAYSKPGSQLGIRLEQSEDWVWITVTDTGPGWSGEELRLILAGSDAKGSQVNMAGAHVLREARRYIEAQGGTFEVVSPGSGLGTRYTATLPRIPVKESHERVPAREKWALIIDDEVTLANSLARLVRALGLTPIVSEDIANAKQTLKQHGVPDLILTDLNLKDGDGISFIADWRAESPIVVPVVLITGSDDDAMRKRAMAAGINEIVTKPVAQRALFEKLEQVLKRSREVKL